MVRIATYAKKLESALKHRPRYDSLDVSATVTLTGTDHKPMIDLEFPDEKVHSLDIESAKSLAEWIKKVTR
jgi:hypothetical protein